LAFFLARAFLYCANNFLRSILYREFSPERAEFAVRRIPGTPDGFPQASEPARDAIAWKPLASRLHLSWGVSQMLIPGGFVNMAIKTNPYVRSSLALAPLLALSMLFGTAASGQTMTPNPAPQGPPTATPPPTPAPPTATPPPTRGDDITRQEVADMDWFLDRHPEIAEQLRKDPSLIDNERWVAAHPAMQEYVQSHPKISAAFRANPNLFMRDEDRYERQEGDHDITRRDVTEMHHFLDNHPEIAEQLRKDPSLIDKREWVANHPALQEYLQTHPGVSEEFRSHPVAFMRDEDRYGRQEGNQEGNYDRDNRYDRGDRNHGELTSFGQFLGGHSNVASELSNDPSLANNKEYLANHPELNDYLKAHPAVTQQLAENPQSVMSSNVVQQGGFTAKPVGPTQKPKSTPNQ
jgi:hypothetical protein